MTNEEYGNYGIKNCELKEYIFDDNGTSLEGEGSPRIATIYGIWRKDIIVKVVTNNGGIGLDGNTLPDVTLSIGGVDYRVATVSLIVEMGKPLSESSLLRFKSLDGQDVSTSSDLEYQLIYVHDTKSPRAVDYSN